MNKEPMKSEPNKHPEHRIQTDTKHLTMKGRAHLFSKAWGYLIWALFLTVVGCRTFGQVDSQVVANPPEDLLSLGQEDEPAVVNTNELKNSGMIEVGELNAAEFVVALPPRSFTVITPTISIQGVDYPTFSLEYASQTTPADVLRELSYSGNYMAFPTTATCEPYQTLGLLYSHSREYPLYGIDAEKPLAFEWNGRVHIYACGWRPGERLTAMLESPSGQTVFDASAPAANDGGVVLRFDKNLLVPDGNFDTNRHLGLYKLRINGQSTGLEQLISVEMPSPRLFYERDALVDTLTLIHFQPDEAVRLFAYEQDYEVEDRYEIIIFNGGFRGNIVESLVGWHGVQVDSDGKLVLSLPRELGHYTYRAIGELSGEANSVRYGPDFYGVKNIEILSPYALLIRRPSDEELNEIASLWHLTNSRKQTQPGIERHELRAQANDTWQWGFSWCAEDPARLEEILQPLTIQFLVNEQRVSFPQIYLYDEILPNGPSCRYWATLLSDWPLAEAVRLEIVYQLGEDIFDGEDTLLAGEYRQIMTVSVEP